MKENKFAIKNNYMELENMKKIFGCFIDNIKELNIEYMKKKKKKYKWINK